MSISYSSDNFELYHGSLLDVLPKEFKKRSVHSCVTSPHNIGEKQPVL